MTTDAAARKPIHILHANLFLDCGGLEAVIMNLCRRVDRERFRCSVLCLEGYDEAYREELAAHDVPVVAVTRQGRFDLGFFGRIKKVIDTGGVDIVHAHSGCFFNAAVGGKLSGAKGILYTAHGLPTVTGIQASVEDAVAARLTDRLVAVSEEIERYLTGTFKGQRHKVRRIINGIDTETFKPSASADAVKRLRAAEGIPADAAVLGTVGRLEPVKNYPMLLHAFARLRQTSPVKMHLVFIGDGSEAAALKNLAAALGIGGEVAFLGLRYNLHTLLPMLDIFILSSLSEGTSISLLEAQASGIPAVVTDVGGNGRIVGEGVNGFLCPSGDDAEMAHKLERLLSNVELRKMMRAHARQTVLDRFSLASMVRAYESLYEELMPPGGRGRT